METRGLVSCLVTVLLVWLMFSRESAVGVFSAVRSSPLGITVHLSEVACRHVFQTDECLIFILPGLSAWWWSMKQVLLIRSVPCSWFHEGPVFIFQVQVWCRFTRQESEPNRPGPWRGLAFINIWTGLENVTNVELIQSFDHQLVKNINSCWDIKKKHN